MTRRKFFALMASIPVGAKRLMGMPVIDTNYRCVMEIPEPVMLHSTVYREHCFVTQEYLDEIARLSNPATGDPKGFVDTFFHSKPIDTL